MAIRQEKKVLTLTIHGKGLGIVPQYFEKKCREIFRTSQGSARVATLTTMHHSYNVATNLGTNLLKGSHDVKKILRKTKGLALVIRKHPVGL